MKPLSTRADFDALVSGTVAVCFARAGAAPSEELERAIGEVEARVTATFARVDLDAPAFAQTVQELRVHREPELLVWARGRLVGRMEGAMTPAQVARFVSAALDRA